MSTPPENITEITANPSSAIVARVRDSFHRALAGKSDLDPRILSIEGMSGKKYRHFINNLVRFLGDARYLEVGTWAGSTLCSAINQNSVRATAIDNWSQFGGPKARFLENLATFRTPQAYVNVIEDDFRSVDFSSIGKFDIYLFDGPHEYQDQHDGLRLALPALESTFVFIVDDWNWEQVRQGTLDAIAAIGVCLDYALEIRTTLDGSHPALAAQHSDWHNGYFISVLSRCTNAFPQLDDAT
jgi:hypothetical protein